MLQAVFAVTTDACTVRLAKSVYGQGSRESRVTLWLTILSPWQWFASNRTLSNSLETTLTVAALALWPWEWSLSSGKQPAGVNTSPRDRPADALDNSLIWLCKALLPAALACILRPTNIIIWVTLSIAMLVSCGSWSKALTLAKATCISGSAILVLSTAADRYFYGTFVLPPLRFLYFNVVKSLAIFYGSNRWDYYFTEGLPLLLTTALPFAGWGIWQALAHRPRSVDEANYRERQAKFLLAVMIITTVLLFSLLAHKEVRFIYPLLPMLHILAAEPLATYFNFGLMPPRPRRRRLILAICMAFNLIVIFYTSMVHQRGVIDVMHYLRHQHETNLALSTTGTAETTVGFLMPCHSTPWRSHLIYPEIDAWALTCEPPLNLTMAEREIYLDEADVFYDDPVAWLNANMAGSAAKGEEQRTLGAPLERPWPQCLVFFSQLEPAIVPILETNSYRESWRTFNTHWHDDWRRKGDVAVWCNT